MAERAGFDAHERARALARKLNAVREPSIRRRLLADAMSDEPPEELVLVLRALLLDSRTRPSSDLAVAVETLAATLSAPELISYPVRTELYEAARLNDCDEIARMLFEVSATPGAEPEAATERPLRPRGRPLSLGERKSLARGHVRDVLEALVRDPHPDVIEILLGNPHLTERDVLAVATQRPAPPESLALIATSERWGARYPIKRALALNPYTPPHITVRLVTTLQTADLRAIVNDTNLPEPLRSQAQALLEAGRDG